MSKYEDLNRVRQKNLLISLVSFHSLLQKNIFLGQKITPSNLLQRFCVDAFLFFLLRESSVNPVYFRGNKKGIHFR